MENACLAISGKGQGVEDWPTSALRADARRNLRRIITAAVELLSEEGVGISMNAIAVRAGVGVGTLYRNFPNKQVLLEVVNRHTLEVIYSETEAIARSALPERAFVDAAHFLVRALASRSELFCAAHLERGSISIGRSQLGAFCELFDGLVTQAQELALIRVDVAGDEILSLVGAACLASAAGNADEADRLFSLMTAGLVPPQQTLVLLDDSAAM